MGPPRAAERQALPSRPVSGLIYPSRLGGQTPGHRSSLPPHLPSPCSTVLGDRQVGDRRQAPAAGVPNSAFDRLRCGRGLQAKSRRRRCGGSGSSMAAPGLLGSPLLLPPPPPRPPRPAGTGLGRAPRSRRPRVKHKHDPRFRGCGCRGQEARTGGCQAGRRQPQARVRPLTPRGWRAGSAGNLRLNPNKRSASGRRAARAARQRPGLTSLPLFFHSVAQECRQPGRHSPPPGPSLQGGLSR